MNPTPRVGDTISPDEAMEEALRIAEHGRGFVAPNPLVGCVIVSSSNRLLSVGAHLKFGEAHAEVNALNGLENRKDAQGASVYVTLEPCSHFGKTPPCVQALIDAKVAKVICGMIDPNPQVAGSGVEALRQQGIEVGHFLKYQKKCTTLIEEFIHLQRTKSPYIALKLAVSLDGQMALENGQSQWITGAETRVHARTLRAHFDATLIGTGTFLNDDPLLDFRQTIFEGKKDNKIILFDPKAKGHNFFKESRLSKIHQKENIFVLTQKEGIENWAPHGVQVVSWSPSYQGWHRSLEDLRSHGVSSIYVEGGSFAISQFLQFKMFQKIFVYQAPKIIGRGMGWSRSFQIKDIDSSLKLRDWTHESIGEDILITARR